jgi:hypothetical protein
MEETLKSGEDKVKWQGIIDAWRASGLDKAKFCRKQKIAASAFYYWCRKLGSDIEQKKSLKAKSRSKPKTKPHLKDKSVPRKKLAVDDKPAFVEISIPKLEKTSPVAGQVFRITTSYGAVMEIPI